MKIHECAFREDLSWSLPKKHGSNVQCCWANNSISPTSTFLLGNIQDSITAVYLTEGTRNLAQPKRKNNGGSEGTPIHCQRFIKIE